MTSNLLESGIISVSVYEVCTNLMQCSSNWSSKLLKETMAQLTPALKEGNKIMKSFEQLNMIKK